VIPIAAAIAAASLASQTPGPDPSGGAAAPRALIIEGSGFFGAPGIELGVVGIVDLDDPSVVSTPARLADDLRFGAADQRPGTGALAAFENTTNAVRLFETTNDGNTLVDSIGYMDPGVAGLAYSNDGATIYATTTVGGFVRVVAADADDASVQSVHNILTDSVSSLAVVPPAHPTLTPGDLYGLALGPFGGLDLVRLDLSTDSVTSSIGVFGIGFSPQFETGLDFASDGTLYAVIQGFDEIAPDVFVEISSHLYTIDPVSGNATDLGVIQGDGTWDAVTLAVLEDTDPTCPADLNGDGAATFPDVGLFLTAFAAGDLAADFSGDGAVSFPDVGAFLAAFAAGCP